MVVQYGRIYIGSCRMFIITSPQFTPPHLKAWGFDTRRGGHQSIEGLGILPCVLASGLETDVPSLRLSHTVKGVRLQVQGLEIRASSLGFRATYCGFRVQVPNLPKIPADCGIWDLQAHDLSTYNRPSGLCRVVE